MKAREAEEALAGQDAGLVEYLKIKAAGKVMAVETLSEPTKLLLNDSWTTFEVDDILHFQVTTYGDKVTNV